MTDENFDAWQATRYSTDALRAAATALRGLLPKIETPDPDPNTEILAKAITGLCIAADHIDRLGQAVAPHIVNVSVDSGESSFDIYGVDSKGALWRYCLGLSSRTNGWEPMPCGISQPADPTNVARIDKNTH